MEKVISENKKYRIVKKIAYGKKLLLTIFM